MRHVLVSVWHFLVSVCDFGFQYDCILWYITSYAYYQVFILGFSESHTLDISHSSSIRYVIVCQCSHGVCVSVLHASFHSTIPQDRTLCRDHNCDTDLQYGMHENYSYYSACRSRKRNMRLFTADQVSISLLIVSAFYS